MVDVGATCRWGALSAVCSGGHLVGLGSAVGQIDGVWMYRGSETDRRSGVLAIRPRRGRLTSQTITVAVIALAMVGLVVLELLRPVHAVDPGARGAIETAIGLAALSTTGLLILNFERSRQLRDLLLVCAVVSAFVTDLIYSTAPALRGATGLEPGRGARLVCNLLIALAFAAAALGPDRTIRGAPRKLVTLGAVACAVSVESILLLDHLVGSGSTAGVSWARGITAALTQPAAFSIQLASTAILLIAGLAFLARAGRGELGAGFLGAVSFLLAGARLQYLTLPAVASDWVTPRDGLRLSAAVVLLFASYLQFSRAKHQESHEALSAERERIARDLHDGVAQDLAYITAQGQQLGLELGPEHPLMIAARRALAGARGAIADLTAAEAPTTEAAIERIATELGRRYDLRVDVEVGTAQPGTPADELTAAEREHLVRILREAIVNAALHGSAQNIEVSLECIGRGLVLHVSDDGSGIADADRVGFGLRTMRARAASLGGELTARPRPGRGTVVQLIVRDRKPLLVPKVGKSVIPRLHRPSRPAARVSGQRRFVLAGKHKRAVERSA